MDRLTDFLTVFFVNNSVKEEQKTRVKKNNKVINYDKDADILQNTTISNEIHVPLKIEKKSDKESIKKEEDSIKKKASIKKQKDSIKKASVKKASVKKESVKKQEDFVSVGGSFTPSQEEGSNLFTESSFSEDGNVDDRRQGTFTDDVDRRQGSIFTDEEENKQISLPVNEFKTQEDKVSLSSLSRSSSYHESESESESKEKFELKKYILKPSEFYKKNILIANDDRKDNSDIISNILYKLSLLKDISDIYSNHIYIFTANDNRKMFKQMLLDNPYLYFTDFHVKQNIDKKIIKENDRIICIIDTDILDDFAKLNDFIDPNIHLILLTLDNTKIIDLYNKLGSKRLLIHKQNKLKSMQKRFFKSINYKDITFEDYYNKINDENTDIKYIILKDDELRYN